MCLEPGNGLRDALLKRILRLEAEQLFRPRYVQTAARLAVRLGRVPDDLAGEPDFRRNHGGKIVDVNLFAGS